jgi:hypothetical protein
VSDDKAFAGYALILIAGVASVLTASVMAGVTSLPSPAVFLEHVALGLMMRASYKSFGGWNWAEWSVTSEPTGAMAAARGFLTPSDGTAGAEA